MGVGVGMTRHFGKNYSGSRVRNFVLKNSLLVTNKRIQGSVFLWIIIMENVGYWYRLCLMKKKSHTHKTKGNIR